MKNQAQFGALPERLRENISVDPSECWIWSGCIRSDGYGLYQRRDEYRGMRAHRAVWSFFNGIVPEGYELHHAACETKRCVNPAHLILVTKAEHTRLHHPRTTHCRKGHELTPENTMIGTDGRRCRQCWHSWYVLDRLKRKRLLA